MCFSSTASFIAGGSLALAGVASLKMVKNPSQIPFASIPLLFGIQQICEGFLWLTLQHRPDSIWREVLSYFFLFFAQALWTTWIPTACLLIEENRNRRKLLWITLLAGVSATLILSYRLINYKVSVEIMGHHLYYGIESPQWIMIISSILYILSIVVSPFLSSLKRMRVVAVLLLLSLIVTKIFFDEYLISVWCFFAAVLSGTIIYVLKESDQPVREKVHHGRMKSWHTGSHIHPH